MTDAAIKLLNERYAKPGETPEDIFKRVAKALSIRDSRFEGELYELMVSGTFLPNTPTIVNAGKKKGSLSACFVLPVADSISSIFESCRDTAMIFQRAGGVGLNFSALRPEGAPLSGGGTSSGPVSFMKLYDTTIEVVKQGGMRKGAAMFVLNHDHPDIFNFCRVKFSRQLTNANLSVGVTDAFMESAVNGDVRNRNLLDLIAFGAWNNGDPGLLFFDRINKDNKGTTPIECCNPCGEVPLPPYGACTLGSINLTKFVDKDQFDFDRFGEVCGLAARALLNVNIINKYPIPAVAKTMQELNPIGVGVMGFADALILLGIRYDSDDCLRFIDSLSGPYVHTSNDVAGDSFYQRSIAPTGSLSIIANCSPSIEPVFAQSFDRHIGIGPVRESRDFYSSEHARFAHQISPEWHLKVQCQWQKYVDAGVSKTVNVPSDTGIEDIKRIYVQAWKGGAKGVTVFRDTSITGVYKCEGDTCLL